MKYQSMALLDFNHPPEYRTPYEKSLIPIAYDLIK